MRRANLPRLKPLGIFDLLLFVPRSPFREGDVDVTRTDGQTSPLTSLECGVELWSHWGGSGGVGV